MGLSSSQIQAAQWNHLQCLLDSLKEKNQFYGRKMQAAGLDSRFESLADFCHRMPLTTKAELVADQQANPPYGSNLSFDRQAYTRFHQTSGSTGTPMRWLDTPNSWQSLIDHWCEVFRAANVTAADHCFFAFSFGPFLGFWTAFEAAEKLGCLCIPGGGMRTPGRLKAMMDNQVTVLCCTPTYAIHLGQVAASEGLDLSQSAVRTILVAGEPGGSIPAIRASIESLWPNARVYDHHGMTEVGPASFPCPANQEVLHILEPGFLTEVLDPETLQPVPPGEPGELVLSNLQRDGMPLLRYRTGDLVKIRKGRCACGRFQTQLIGGILGRRDDMVIIRGVNLYPAAIETIVRQCTGILEYQVLIEEHQGLNQLCIQIETEPGDMESQSLLSQKLHAAFNLRIQVEVMPPGSLPRYELKAKRWQRIRKNS